MNWAWDQRLAPGPKLILMALADAADDDGVCWPSVARVSSKCCVSTRTVQRVIQEFTVKDLLIVTNRFSATGRQKSNGYRLQLSKRAYPDKLSPSPAIAQSEGDNLSGTGATPAVRAGGDNIMSPQEPPYESSEQPPLRAPTRASCTLYFPTALAPDERAAATSIVQGIEQAAAQALLDELCAAMESRSIRTSPIQWLRSLTRRFRDGKFEPTGGVGVAAKRKRLEELANLQRTSSETAPSSKAVALAAIATAKAALAKGKVGQHDN